MPTIDGDVPPLVGVGEEFDADPDELLVLDGASTLEACWKPHAAASRAGATTVSARERGLFMITNLLRRAPIRQRPAFDFGGFIGSATIELKR
jgi:hypothetical protein